MQCVIWATTTVAVRGRVIKRKQAEVEDMRTGGGEE